MPSIPASHRRHSSFGSSLRPGSADLLDAQQGLGPPNFLSRLQASRARAYDDDAAEEFDESAPAPVIARGELARGAWAQRDCVGSDQGAPSIRTRSFNMASWNALTKSPQPVDRVQHITFAEGDSEPYPSKSSSSHLEPALPSRRKSFNAFVPTSQSQRTKPQPLTLHPSLSNFTDAPASAPAVPRQYRPQSSAGTERLPSRPSSSSVQSRKSSRSTKRPQTRVRRDSQGSYLGAASTTSREYNPSLKIGRSHSHDFGSVADDISEGSRGFGKFEMDSLVDEGFSDAAPSPSKFILDMYVTT